MLRIVFMGTPQFAVPALSAVLDAGHDVVAVYTKTPRPAGRGMGLQKSPVHEVAESASIPVLTPASLKGADQQRTFAAHGADIAIVVAYGLILPRAILEAPRHGCLNLHASALPRWRGAAPIQRAIMAGDRQTAATIMRMDEGLDTGPVCLMEPIDVALDTTAGDLHDHMAGVGARLLLRALTAVQDNGLQCAPQGMDGVTYAEKVSKSETQIDFAQPAAHVRNLIHGLSPFPGAWFVAGAAGRVKVLRASVVEGDAPPGTVLDDALTIACADGAVRLHQVQRAGKQPMTAQEFLRGARIARGMRMTAGDPRT